MTDPWKRRVETLLDQVNFVGFESRVQIYAVEKNGVAVYVGSTNQAIKSRNRCHIRNAKRGSHLPIHCWMRDSSFAFDVRLLETVSERERADAERRWCAHFGAVLLNVTDGGPGLSGHAFAGTAHAQAIAEAQKTGAHFDCLECGASFWRKLREIKLGNNKFCSRAFYQTWQRGRSKSKRAAQWVR